MAVDYLRVSVTDECNLRCVYCNPLGSRRPARREETLSFDEIRRVVDLCARCGIRKVRLTGGEPLLREGIVELVRKLAGVPDVQELSLTTNGVLLGSLAAPLKEAGLRRVNISLDAVEPECYRRIAGEDMVSQVFAGMHKAMEVGLSPVRINCVVVRDVNLSQVWALAEISLRLPVTVRFIEYCPTSRLTGPADGYVPNSEVRAAIESRFGPMSGIVLPDSNGPAIYFKITGAAGAIGFISGRSTVFCRRCTRLRLTCDGMLMPCLHAARSYDLRKLLRTGAGDETILNLVRRAIREKEGYTRLSSGTEDFLMQSIGG